MSDKPADYGREVRDTIVKSSLTGVVATAIAITVFSPAGFGGFIGTSVASGLGLDPNATAADDPYAELPAFPSPFSAEELNAVRDQLARTTVSLEITRAATEARIEYIRSLALSDRATAFTPATQVVEAPVLRLTTAEPVMATPAPDVVAAAPTGETAPFPDRDLEFAALLLAHENR